MLKNLNVICFFTTTCITSLVTSLGWADLSQLKPEAQKFTSAQESFEKVHRMLLNEHIHQISEKELYLAATQGMLNALNRGGPQCNSLMTPNQIKQLKGSLNSNVTGIGVGVQFLSQTGTAYIRQVLKDSPAEKEDLKVGDQILSVNGKLYKNRPAIEMHDDIRGKEGEIVKMKILRGDQVLEKAIARKKVSWGPVEGQFAQKSPSDPKIGILKIRSFAHSSPEEVKKHLVNFQKAKGLIVDLRSNAGGIFTKAIDSIDYFLPKGKVIAVLKGRSGKTHTYLSKQSPLVKAPVIVLIDRKTSAGAELMAANLKENLGARLVGENTFGKWNSQVIRHLPNNFAVRYTVHQFLGPNKRHYDGIGLSPDVAIIRAIKPLKSSRIVPATSRAHGQPSDRQMSTAVQLLKLMI